MLKQYGNGATALVLMLAFLLIALSFSQPTNPSAGHVSGQPTSEQTIGENRDPTADRGDPGNERAGGDEPAKATDQKQRKASGNWGVSDWIAGVATLAALLQFAALIWTIQVMRGSARMEQRAYLSISNSSVEFDPATRKFRVMIVFQNSGNTPAYDCVIEMHMVILDRYQPITATFSPQGPPALMYALIGPHNPFTGADAIALDADTTLEQIKERDKLIYVLGRVDYEDIFRQKRWLTFRTFIRELPGRGWVLMPSTNKGNDADR